MIRSEGRTMRGTVGADVGCSEDFLTGQREIPARRERRPADIELGALGAIAGSDLGATNRTLPGDPGPDPDRGAPSAMRPAVPRRDMRKIIGACRTIRQRPTTWGVLGRRGRALLSAVGGRTSTAPPGAFPPGGRGPRELAVRAPLPRRHEGWRRGPGPDRRRVRARHRERDRERRLRARWFGDMIEEAWPTAPSARRLPGRPGGGRGVTVPTGGVDRTCLDRTDRWHRRAKRQTVRMSRERRGTHPCGSRRRDLDDIVTSALDAGRNPARSSRLVGGGSESDRSGECVSGQAILP